MSDKNDTNESLEEGQEALPPGDAEPTEVTEVSCRSDRSYWW